MSTIKNYTTRTAALKATVADISKLKVKGKDVATSVKHPDDTREVITENDLWGSWAEITSDGEIVFHNDEVTNPNASKNSPWNTSITKVEDNKAYVGDTLFANVQTEKMKYGSWMFYECSALTAFTSDLNSLTNGYGLFFDCSNLTTFTSDSSDSPVNLSSLTNGDYMFGNCSNLRKFTSDLSSLTYGRYMFYKCSNLTTFTSNLSSLTHGAGMFYHCDSLRTFTNDLSSLTNGDSMFYNCSKFRKFTSDLSSLTNGDSMFADCSNLTTFTSNLGFLDNGYEMFQNCSNLTTFTSDLSSLRNGYKMFYNCKLDTDSLMHIAETINDVRDLTNDYVAIYKTIHIGIGNTTPTEEEKELLTEIHNKGWQVFVMGNGGASSEFVPTAVIPEEGEMPQIIPFYAKPVESDEEYAEYVGEDGKYYNILGGQFIFVDDPETYGMFVSLEDAAANMRLTKIEKKEIETA